MKMYSRKSAWAAILVLAVIFVRTSPQDTPAGNNDPCPDQCECRIGWNGLEVSCVMKNLTSIPLPLPVNTVDLDLSYNQLQNLSAGIFDNCTKLEELDLSDNQLQNLPAGIFDHCTKLKELHLSRNQLQNLPAGIFDHCTKLEELVSSCSASSLDDCTKLVGESHPDSYLRFCVCSTNNGKDCKYVWRLSKNKLQNLTAGIFDHCTELKELYLENNQLKDLPQDILRNNTKLDYLALRNCQLKALPLDIFRRNTKLRTLLVHENQLKALPQGIFSNNIKLSKLNLENNQLKALPRGIFSTNIWLGDLRLSYNQLKALPEGIFSNNTRLAYLGLGNNQLEDVPQGLFATNVNLDQISLQHNQLKALPEGIFSNNTRLNFLFLNNNQLKGFPHGIFHHNIYLRYMWLDNNQLKGLPQGFLATITNLQYVDLSHNEIEYLPEGCCNAPGALTLQQNKIKVISNKTFGTYVKYLFLLRNDLKNIPFRAFYNLYTDQAGDKEQIIILSDNPIETIEPEAFRPGIPHLLIYLLRTKLKILNLESVIGVGGLDSQLLLKNRTASILRYKPKYCTIYLSPVSDDSEVIYMYVEDSFDIVLLSAYTKAYTTALLASGFDVRVQGDLFEFAFFPCPLGTFTNISTKEDPEPCQNCPPGGFYSDTLAYVGESCKTCPNGSFVAFDKAPGKQHQDCKSCPLGTETDFFAGNRACKCLEGQYRTHMFKECFKCGQGGLKCQDDYASLKSGHWWEWRNKTHKNHYQVFIKNLLASSPTLDVYHVQYPYAVPTPYKCPVEEACKGGLDSQCENGYEGPLCSVCSYGYFKQLKLCARCPSKAWIAGQLSIVLVVVLIVIALLVWWSHRNIKKKKEKGLLMDMFLSKVKIVIGFYQVTYGLLEVFSYIKWPGSLESIAKYSGFLQLNVMQIAPVQCIFPELRLNAFGSLFVLMGMNAAIICFSGIAYGVHRLIIFRNHTLEDDEKSRKVSQSKEFVYRNLFFFLFTTYLSMCSKTANVLPPACRKLCRDGKEEHCSEYLKADYSVSCQGKEYNQFLIVAFISTAYIFVLPAAAFIAIWRQRRAILKEGGAGRSQGQASSKEMISGLCFLFVNYKTHSWYWELVETTRKVILTCGLIFVGQESRSYIGLALVISGMYGILFAWVKPLQDVMENRLMTASLAVTVFNLVIGAVSKIPAENIMTGWMGADTDAVFFKILVFAANSLVIFLLVVQYALYLYGYFKEWRKNPHCSFSCFLGLFLPDLQGEVRGQVGKNVLRTKLQTGDLEMITLDVTLEEGEQGDDHAVAPQDDNDPVAKISKTKRNQGNQTEFPTILAVADVLVHDPIEDTHL